MSLLWDTQGSGSGENTTEELVCTTLNLVHGIKSRVPIPEKVGGLINTTPPNSIFKKVGRTLVITSVWICMETFVRITEEMNF